MMHMRVRTLMNGDNVATLYCDGMVVMEIEDTHKDSLGCRLIDVLVAQGLCTGSEADWSDYTFRCRIAID